MAVWGAEHATSRSRRLPTILTFPRGWERNFFCFFQTAETGNRTPNSGVKGSGANHYPRAPAEIMVFRGAVYKLKSRVSSTEPCSTCSSKLVSEKDLSILIFLMPATKVGFKPSQSHSRDTQLVYLLECCGRWYRTPQTNQVKSKL